MKNIKLIAVSVISIAILAACGGGGSSNSTAATSAEGLWNGTTSNGRTVSGLVLDDGVFWVLYTSQTNSNIIAGAVQGSGTSNNGSFASSNALDFNLEGLGIIPANLSASYTQKQNFNGTVTYPTLNQTVTFTSKYSADYDQTPSLATIAGTYAGTAAVKDGSESGTVTISSSGVVNFVGSSSCTSTGTVTPRAKGNVYNLSVTFGGAPCSNANSTVTGIGYFDAATKRLYGLGLNSARSNGFIFVGTKS